MNNELNAELVPRQRYRIAAGQTIPVAIQRPANDASAAGELINVSSSGIRVLADAPLKFGEKVVLHIVDDEIELNATIPSEVRWIRNADGGHRWTAGCAFEEEFDCEILETWLDRGLLERRQTDRHRGVFPATVEITGACDGEVDVDLTDIGMGGFSFRSPVAGTAGGRVRLSPEGEQFGAADGRIMWRMEEDGEYLIGCEWMNRAGVFLAKHLMDSLVAKANTPKSKWGEQAFAAAVVGAIALFVGIVIGTVNASVADPTAETHDDWFVAD